MKQIGYNLSDNKITYTYTTTKIIIYIHTSLHNIYLFIDDHADMQVMTSWSVRQIYESSQPKQGWCPEDPI